MSNPFESSYRNRLSAKSAMPGVVKGYIAFCIVSAIVLSGYVLMGIGLMVFSEQLLVFWFQPNTKAYFGVAAR